MIVLNMNPRNPNVKIDSVTRLINEFTTEEKKIKPFLHSLESEVKANPRQAKKLTKLMSTTSTMLTAILFTNLAPSNDLIEIDPELKQMFILAMVIVVVLAFVAAMIAGMVAGIWKMFPFFGGDGADRWNQSIIKGFSQVLAAPVIIGIIVILFSLLFSKLPFFNPVEQAVKILLEK